VDMDIRLSAENQSHIECSACACHASWDTQDRYYCADTDVCEVSNFFFGITFTFRSTLTTRFLLDAEAVRPTVVTSLLTTLSVGIRNSVIEYIS